MIFFAYELSNDSLHMYFNSENFNKYLKTIIKEKKKIKYKIYFYFSFPHHSQE